MLNNYADSISLNQPPVKKSGAAGEDPAQIRTQGDATRAGRFYTGTSTLCGQRLTDHSGEGLVWRGSCTIKCNKTQLTAPMMAERINIDR